MIERKSCVICKKPDGQEDHECMQWLIDEVKRLNALVCELEAYNYELQFQANLIDDGWVSVNDRLPEHQEPVLIYRKPSEMLLSKDSEHCCILQAAYDKDVGSIGWYDFQDESDIKDDDLFTVTHWQPLPSPPKDRT